MRVIRFLLTALMAFSALPNLHAQQPPQRDPQALVLMQRAVASMAGVLPSDSVATGNVVIVAGSKTENGTIRILTRGTDESAEQIQTRDTQRAVIYSQNWAKETDGSSVRRLPMELVVTSQSADFPLPLLAGALSNGDAAFSFLGPESLDGTAVYHIRFWNTFASNAQLQPVAEFSTRDLWVDAASGLPRKLSYDRRAAGGSQGRIAAAVFYSDYRNIGGVLYPFQIQKSLNGTPWATITLQSVAFNTGLTDADFPAR